MPQHPYEKSFQKLDPDTVSDQAAISTAGNEPAELSGVSNLERLLGVSYVNEAAADFQPGDSVGDCQIVRFLAEGGMGRVYEARQRRPNRIVAVKLIRPHRLTQAAIHRFNYEAEVLGRLQHPSIAQIFSAGIEKRKSEEIPFLVMEFVPDSLSMTSYARVHSLTIGERVNLFLAACAGLAYAHRNGVLHRDLKPKNIIVGDTGAVKVIDFGVSRLVRGGNGLPANDTATGELVGTLQAMSPEQVSATAAEIGTPTDVYALGLILYELLANRRAYDCNSESLEAVIKRIQEFNPPALNTLVPGISRDLSMIVATCLRKDSKERYQSAGDLAADLNRYLVGSPIRARDPSLIDSLRYWCKRNRLLMAGMSLLAGVLMASVVTITLFALRAEKSRVAAIKERNRVSGMLDFFLDAFRASSPELQGPDTQLRDVLEPAIEDAEVAFASDPRSLAEVQLTLGQTLRSLSALDAANVAVEAAERSMTTLNWPEDSQPEIAAKVLLERAELELVRGNYAGAQAVLAEGIRQAYAIDPRASLYADGLALEAGIYFQLSDLDEAEKVLRKSLALMEEAGDDGDDYSDRLIFLANILFSTRARFQEAEVVVERIVGLEEKRHGPEHPRVARALQQLARMYTVRIETAALVEPILRHAAELIEKAYGPEHPATASAIAKLAQSLIRSDHLDEAKQLIERSLAIYEKHFGEQHDKTAAAIELLANWYAAGRDYAAALPLQEQAVRILRQSGSEERGTVQNSLITLGGYRAKLGDKSGAVTAYQEVWRVLEPMAVPDSKAAVDNIQSVVLLASLVEVLLEQGKYVEAEKYARQCLDIAENNFDDGHPIWRFRGRVPIVNVLLLTDRIDEARLIVTACRDVFRMANPEHPEWKRIRELEKRLQVADTALREPAL